MGPAETRYARSGQTNIAYQVVGDGPLDVVYVPGWVSHVEMCWDDPLIAAFLNQIAGFARLILFDKRGTGMSDRVPDSQLPTLEERADDLLVVMDAVGSQRAAVFGVSEGGTLSAYFAASHPDRTSALVMFGAYAKRIWAPDYPWAPTPEEREIEYREVEQNWGRSMDLAKYVPSKVDDVEFIRQLATYFRNAASPGAAVSLLRMNTQIDISGILGSIRVPTLVMHRTGDLDCNVAEGRWIADRIEGAVFRELPGVDHLPWVGNSQDVTGEMQKFLTGRRPAPKAERVLASILFTDIVGSTEMARRMGDKAWKMVLNLHDNFCDAEVAGLNGRMVKKTGDGILATFDGPGRAIACARRIIERGHAAGLDIRAGLHTGECELRGQDEIAGVAVHLAARVCALAGDNQVMVSRTVRDLVAGSGFDFEDRGPHVLKGFAEPWHLFSVM